MPVKKLFLGLDPGLTGGISVVNYAGMLECFTEMPKTNRDILNWLWEYAPRSGFRPVARIELVHSFPGQGVSSTFKFGKGFGGLLMALDVIKIPYETVSPRSWQKELGVRPRKKKGKKFLETKRQFKVRLKEHAQRLFPKFDIPVDPADSVLIAEYCRRTTI